MVRTAAAAGKLTQGYHGVVLGLRLERLPPAVGGGGKPASQAGPSAGNRAPPAPVLPNTHITV